MNRKKTNAIGAGTKNLSVNVPEDVQSQLKEKAAKRGITISVFVRQLLMRAVDRKIQRLADQSGMPVSEYIDRVLDDAIAEKVTYRVERSNKRVS